MTGKRRERGEKFKKKGQPTGGLRKKKENGQQTTK
jgi:hypothetical protein